MSKNISELNFMGAITESPRVFRALYGKVINNMPILLSGKNEAGKVVDVRREPITPKRLLHERIHCENGQDRQLLRNHYVFTAMPVMDNPDGSGEVKLVHYSQEKIREVVNSLSPADLEKIRYGALPITDDIYHAVPDADACILSPSVANQFREYGYSDERERRRTWEYMAEGELALVDNNLKLVQEKKGGDFSNRMGLWLSDHKEGLRLLVVGSVGIDDSDARGYYDLDYSDGRFVGVVAPEVLNQARSASAKNGGPYKLPEEFTSSPLDARVQNALKVTQAFEHNGTLYVPVTASNVKLNQ